MGLRRLVSSLAGALVFGFSGLQSNRIGVFWILILSLVSYVARFVIYALMYKPFQDQQDGVMECTWSTGKKSPSLGIAAKVKGFGVGFEVNLVPIQMWELVAPIRRKPSILEPQLDENLSRLI